MNEIDHLFHTKVARLKEAHFKWAKRSAWALGIWFIAGIVVGIGTWFIQKPINRDGIMFGGVLGLGGAVFFIGIMLTRMVLPMPDIQCPQCGYDWKGSVPNDDWLTWKCCPGCGLIMMDDIRQHEKL